MLAAAGSHPDGLEDGGEAVSARVSGGVHDRGTFASPKRPRWCVRLRCGTQGAEAGVNRPGFPGLQLLGGWSRDEAHSTFLPQVRERAVRMVRAHQREQGSR